MALHRMLSLTGLSKRADNGEPLNMIDGDSLEQVVFDTIAKTIKVYQHFHCPPSQALTLTKREKCAVFRSRKGCRDLRTGRGGTNFSKRKNSTASHQSSYLYNRY